MTKIVFFDLETTGLDPKIHGIHQLGGCIEINGKVVREFDFKIKPPSGIQVDEGALKVAGITLEDLKSYPTEDFVFMAFRKMLGEFVDKFDKYDKAFLAGWNNAVFDNAFLRAFFERNGDQYFGSWFWSNTIDVMILASEYLKHDRATFPNFKLVTVAEKLLPFVDPEKAHDANYDIEMTRNIYHLITNI